MQAAARATHTVRTVGRRFMSGGHGEAVEYEGAEKILRSYFPHNHQIVIFVLGTYGVVIGGTMAVKNAQKAAEPKPTPQKPDYHTVKVVGDVPSVEDEAFPDFIAEEENIEKWIASLEQMEE